MILIVNNISASLYENSEIGNLTISKIGNFNNKVWYDDPNQV